MKLLLTSGGVSNPSIRDALVDLVGKPVEETSVLCVPTAEWGHPMCTPASVLRFVSGQAASPTASLPWGSAGVLELTALPSIGKERWEPWVRDADVLLVDGGDTAYLRHWVRESGLLEVVATLSDLVWVGVSAGSMVMTPRTGARFIRWPSPGSDDTALGLVDFSIFPHLDHEAMPGNTLAEAEKWAAEIAGPAYALDDQSAIVVDDGRVDVVSEGRWRAFGR